MTDITSSDDNPIVAFIDYQNTHPDAQALIDFFLTLIQDRFSGSFGLMGVDQNTGENDSLILDTPDHEGWKKVSEDLLAQHLKNSNAKIIPIQIGTKRIGTFYLFSGDDQAYQNIPALCQLLAQDLEISSQQHQIDELSSKLNKESQRNNLLYSIAHDLRTPLTGIIGLSDVLLDMEQTPAEKGVVVEIRNDATRLHEILENVLSLVRLSQDSLHIPKQLECLNEIAEEAIETFSKGKFKDRRIELEGDELLFAQVNARLIYQVLINLIDNAIKHSPEDSTIYVRVYEKDGTAHLDVADEGEGIAPANLPHLFDLYFTTRANRDNALKGTGLGLPIVASIVQAHSGSISAANREDRRGALFSIRLPYTPIQA